MSWSGRNFDIRSISILKSILKPNFTDSFDPFTLQWPDQSRSSIPIVSGWTRLYGTVARAFTATFFTTIYSHSFHSDTVAVGVLWKCQKMTDDALLPSRVVCCESHSSQKGQVCVNEKKCDSQLGGRGVGWRIALTRPSDGYFAS